MATRTVTVRRRLGAHARDLFATLTDPELFTQVRGIRAVRIIEAGSDGPTGVGTVRRIEFVGGYLVEEIVDVGAPIRFDYLIRDAPVSLDHRFGRIEFHDRDGHTEAVWTSELAFEQPLIGGVIARVAVIVSHVGFALVLREIDRTATPGPHHR
ncbi:SRPBCC family protein [Williamsia sterculiae]|uniref:Polyketide cyclase / dehydrase and lipid transport n=1 Tax=Williamsia sterculiae TaxID=1344003 RepID=A0A1N7EQV6_9NOCA|nr:SRPBCC family protein [Williamsia sterculiae]SIR90493.1 Polyketide cyclase / dehydrase and lipid transport [Williamsia sterculiae]